MLHILLTISDPGLTTKKISWRIQTLKHLFGYILHFQITITHFLHVYHQNISWTKSHGHHHLLTLTASGLFLLLGVYERYKEFPSYLHCTSSNQDQIIHYDVYNLSWPSTIIPGKFWTKTSWTGHDTFLPNPLNKNILYIYIYIYIYICGFKTSSNAFRLPYSIISFL